MKRTITMFTLFAMTVCSSWFIGSLIISSIQDGFVRYSLLLAGNASAFTLFFWYAFIKKPPKGNGGHGQALLGCGESCRKKPAGAAAVIEREDE